MDMADLEAKLADTQARLKLIVTDGVFFHGWRYCAIERDM